MWYGLILYNLLFHYFHVALVNAGLFDVPFFYVTIFKSHNSILHKLILHWFNIGLFGVAPLEWCTINVALF